MSQISSFCCRYSIFNILALMTLCAAIMGVARWLGPQWSWSCFLVAYAFAPSIAMAGLLVLPEHNPFVRYGTAAMTLVSLAIAMMLLCGIYYGGEAVWFALAGTLIEWPGQIGVLVCLRFLWGSEATRKLHGSGRHTS